MNARSHFKDVLATILLYTGVPVVAAAILSPFGFHQSYVIMIFAALIWIFHTEIRIRGLEKKTTKKSKKGGKK